MYELFNSGTWLNVYEAQDIEDQYTNVISGLTNLFEAAFPIK